MDIFSWEFSWVVTNINVFWAGLDMGNFYPPKMVPFFW